MGLHEEVFQELFEKARKLGLEPNTFASGDLAERCSWMMPFMSDKKLYLKGDHSIHAQFSNYRGSYVRISNLDEKEVGITLDEYEELMSTTERELIPKYELCWVRMTAGLRGFDHVEEVEGMKDARRAIVTHHAPYSLEVRFGNSLDAIDFVDQQITPKNELPPYLQVVK